MTFFDQSSGRFDTTNSENKKRCSKKKTWYQLINDDLTILNLNNWEKIAIEKINFNNSIENKLNVLLKNYLDGNPLYP